MALSGIVVLCNMLMMAIPGVEILAVRLFTCIHQMAPMSMAQDMRSLSAEVLG